LFNCKIFFVNDANLATLYEASRPNCNAGKSIYLTFSTGIGGGIAKDGKLLLKASDAFEPGHIKYSYNGHSLEWEDIAAAKPLVSLYKVKTLQDAVLDDARLEDLVDRLSLGLLDIIVSESPDTIIIGGPICFIYDKFIQSLEANLRAKLQATPKFKKAHRPTESVIYGAYLYSKQNYRK
jgi:predicted NBD/HSP70 family sugar kinase